jgi:hypothetical protein
MVIPAPVAPKKGPSHYYTARRIMIACCAPFLVGIVVGVLVMLLIPEASNDPDSETYKQMKAIIAGRASWIYGGQKRLKGQLGDQPDTFVGPNRTGELAYLQDTAIITMATGDASAKDAIALMQSLRDVGTQVPHLIVLLVRGGTGSSDCTNSTWRAIHDREKVDRSATNTIAPEIASQRYLDVFARQGVRTLLIDPVPDTPYTKIPGGRKIFWGMAFNKLRVFGMTKYKKIMWMDSDAFVIKNIDNLMKEPALTGAIVTACCNVNGPGYAGGGIWILEPSKELYTDLLSFIAKPVPGTLNDPWYI